VGILLGYNNASKTIVPNYRLEVGAREWMDLSQKLKKKSVQNKNFNIKQGNLKGTVTSPVFDFSLRDQQQQIVHSLGGNRLLIKLPYVGRATEPVQVGLYSAEIDQQGVISSVLSAVPGEIVAVKPGNTVNYGYVAVLLDELPEHVLLLDLKLKKRQEITSG
jgi:hypothetical protein